MNLARELHTELRGDFLLYGKIFKKLPKDLEIDFTLSISVIFPPVKIRIDASVGNGLV